MQQKKYSEEFKRQAVDRALSVDQPKTLTAIEIGVSVDTLRDWIKLFGPAESIATPDDKSDRAEITRLRKALARAEMERDILKKAIGIFSEEQR
jgi:transposase